MLDSVLVEAGTVHWMLSEVGPSGRMYCSWGYTEGPKHTGGQKIMFRTVFRIRIRVHKTDPDPDAITLAKINIFDTNSQRDGEYK